MRHLPPVGVGKHSRSRCSHIAHSDPRPIGPGQIATLAEVHASIDAIGSLFRRYRTLLTGHTGDGLTPVIIDNWQAIFRQPWIT
jgi:hypothetical protein